MAGSYKLNLLFAVFGFAMFFFFSFSVDFYLYAVWRGLAAFIIFYFFMYLVRWLWGIALKETSKVKTDSLDHMASDEKIKEVSKVVKDLLREDEERS
ncbi:hypothetical protein [Bacillus sp. 1P06AnD]|uniref:hypothetical protein n=1 Tax=Bacillus sp. 1P06AnD TaxID=3132208 RepID=UPI0039A01A5F